MRSGHSQHHPTEHFFPGPSLGNAVLNNFHLLSLLQGFSESFTCGTHFRRGESILQTYLPTEPFFHGAGFLRTGFVDAGFSPVWPFLLDSHEVGLPPFQGCGHSCSSMGESLSLTWPPNSRGGSRRLCFRFQVQDFPDFLLLCPSPLPKTISSGSGLQLLEPRSHLWVIATLLNSRET